MYSNNIKHSGYRHTQLYLLLYQARLIQHGSDIFYYFSNGRTKDSKELSNDEMKSIINCLQKSNNSGFDNTCDFVIGITNVKKILHLCHQYGWLKFDVSKQVNIVDYNRLNDWMLKYSYLNKRLREYKYSELPQLVTQFEQMLMNNLFQI